MLTEVIGQGSATAEFLERWRAPGAAASRVWEERFGEQVYGPLAEAAMADALKQAGLLPGQVDHLIVAGLPARAVSHTVRAAGVRAEAVADYAARIGNAGTAQPGILLADVLDRAGPGETILLVVLADGAFALALRTTEALASHRQAQPVAAQIAAGSTALDYATFLSWRGFLNREPPRRPDPDRSRHRHHGAEQTGSSGSSRRNARAAGRGACRRTGSASGAERWTRWSPSRSPTYPRP